MYPSLSPRGQLAIFGVAWAQITGLLVALLSMGGALPPVAALLLSLPVAAFYAWDGLALYYLARAVPVRHAGPLRLVVTHSAVAIVTASVWTAVGRGIVEVLYRIGIPAPAEGAAGAFSPTPAAAYARAAPVVFGVGLLLTLLALVIHYLILEIEHSRAAQTRALEFQLHSRGAELKALRAQLQPHFLYNALNSINALIRSDPVAARNICVQLGDLLRRSLTFGARDRIPLEQELELVEALLEIEKVRFGERLEYRLDVTEEARRQQLPPLLLQPLVENAVTHGIAGLLDGGTVSVAGSVESGRLRLVIENPRDESGSRRGTGIGLENVRRRLLALYGREAELKVEGQATLFRVVVTLPVEDDEDGESDQIPTPPSIVTAAPVVKDDSSEAR